MRFNRRVRSLLGGFFVGFLIAFTLFCLLGCKSHTAKIAKAAQESSRAAGEIIAHAEAAQNEVASPPEEVPPTPAVTAWLGKITSHLLAIGQKAHEVRDNQATIGNQIPHVEDRVPWWATLLKLLAVVGGLVVVVYVLWATGILKVIRAWLWAHGLLVPKAKVSSAKLDVEALEDPAKLPQAIASRRTADPAYDAAFRKVKGKLP